MAHKAVVFIRTLSESQAKKSSPTEQEADCRRLASEKRLTVVRVYRDIEKYRAKNKLVEPIIDLPTYDVFIKMRAENQTHPSQRIQGEKQPSRKR